MQDAHDVSLNFGRGFSQLLPSPGLVRAVRKEVAARAHHVLHVVQPADLGYLNYLLGSQPSHDGSPQTARVFVRQHVLVCQVQEADQCSGEKLRKPFFADS